ncbi:MAG: hypothetical protein ACC628_00945 [Pirellulaceae bacterium]
MLPSGELTSDRWPEEELIEALQLPSGGDTSYAGLVWHDDMLWISYYASHEGKTSIYLAKVKFPTGESANKTAGMAAMIEPMLGT